MESCFRKSPFSCSGFKTTPTLTLNADGKCIACRSSYILKQDSLPASYRSFLNKQGGKDSVILHGVKDIATGIPFSNLKGIEKFYASCGVDIKLDPKMKVPCSVCIFS